MCKPHSTPHSKVRGTGKVHQGITKLEQEAKAWNIAYIGPAADWCRVSRLADRELLKALC